MMHRNTFVNSPQVLLPTFQMRLSNIFLAGQLTGVEGYMESTVSGLVAESMRHGWRTGAAL